MKVNFEEAYQFDFGELRSEYIIVSRSSKLFS